MSRFKLAIVAPLALLGVFSLFGVSALDFLSDAEAQKADGKTLGGGKAEKIPELPPHVVARVGDDLIYGDEVLERIQTIELSRNLPVEKQLVGPAYEYTINTRLLRKEAKRIGITSTEADKKKEVEAHIERLKIKVNKDFGGSISWENYLQQRNLTHQMLYKQIYAKSELIVLRRRLVNYWEKTTTGAAFIEIRFKSRKKALDALAKIDGKVAAKKENKAPVKEIFFGEAFFHARGNDSPKVYAFIESPMAEPLRKTVFEELKDNTYSGVVKVAEDDFRIFYLETLHVRKKLPFSQLKGLIDKEGPVDNDSRFRRWVNAVYLSGRYRVQFRFPGRKTITTATKKDAKKATDKNTPKED